MKTKVQDELAPIEQGRAAYKAGQPASVVSLLLTLEEYAVWREGWIAAFVEEFPQ